LLKKALITGGSGFLGKAINHYLSENGYEVFTFDTSSGKKNHFQGSVVNFEEILSAVSGIDVVFHLAGLLGTSELIEQNLAAVDVNIKGTVNVLDACFQKNVSTVFVPTKPDRWLNTYTITKKAGEEFAKLYSQVKGLDVRILRWLNAYGPDQKAFPTRKVAPAMITQALENVDIEVWGNGEQTVYLIYSEDLARNTVLYTLKQNGDSVVRDTGNIVEMSVNDLALLIKKLTKSNSTIKHLPMRLGEDPKKILKPLPGPTAAEILDLTDSTMPIEKGLVTTIEYYSQLSTEIRKKALEFYQKK